MYCDWNTFMIESENITWAVQGKDGTISVALGCSFLPSSCYMVEGEF
jgi:hypothetical protein